MQPSAHNLVCLPFETVQLENSQENKETFDTPYIDFIRNDKNR